MKKKNITAAELMARLNADPRFVAERQKREEELEKRAAEWTRAEQPLVEELRQAGFKVSSAWDLVNTSTPYPKALPILLDHLQKPYPGPVRDGIARALAVPEARFGWEVIVRCFRNETEERVKDGLACAIAETADDGVIDEVIAFVRNPHEVSRVLLLRALERSADPRARAVLMELGADPILGTESRAALRRLQRGEKRRRRT
ncbi:MAG: HEAT repeat domain-containing protein [Deltaproteobacteria bacterium]